MPCAPPNPRLRPAVPEDLGLSFSELGGHVIKAYAELRDVDIIHDHTLAGPLYAHRPPGIPVVTTIHGPLSPSYAPLYRDMAQDTAIIAISHDQCSRVEDLEISAVIHHGIDLSAVSVGRGAGGDTPVLWAVCARTRGFWKR